MVNLSTLQNMPNANLSLCPQTSPRAQQSTGFPGVIKSVTLGDLHGNALKLLYFLKAEGIINISPAHYRRFTEAYTLCEIDSRIPYRLAILNAKLANDVDGVNALTTQMDSIPQTTLDREQGQRVQGSKILHREILQHITVVPGAKFRAIGDVLGDRGANDLLTLQLIGKLVDGKVDVEILLSNHDSLFIIWMEAKLRGENVEAWTQVHPTQAESLKRLDELVNLGVINIDYLKPLYEKYQSTLKLLSYDYDEQGRLMLYSHAHLDERGVLSMAKGLVMEYGQRMPSDLKTALQAIIDRLAQDPTAMISEEDTKALIDNINLVVRHCALHNQLTELIKLNNHLMTAGQKGGKGIDPEVNPVHYALWNRQDLDRLPRSRPKNINIINVHGHHTYEQDHAICLDNSFGKGAENDQGNLSYTKTCPINVLVIRHQQLLEIMAFLAKHDNITMTHNTDGSINISPSAVQSNHPTVREACRIITACFHGTLISDEPPTYHEKVNKAWHEIDTLVEAEIHAGPATKAKRAINDAVTARQPTGPTATTNLLMNTWTESKDRLAKEATETAAPSRPSLN